MNQCMEFSTQEENNLVVLHTGFYINADPGGKRVRILKRTPGLVIRRYNEQVVIAIPTGETVLVSESACEKLQ